MNILPYSGKKGTCISTIYFCLMFVELYSLHVENIFWDSSVCLSDYSIWNIRYMLMLRRAVWVKWCYVYSIHTTAVRNTWLAVSCGSRVHLLEVCFVYAGLVVRCAPPLTTVRAVDRHFQGSGSALYISQHALTDPHLGLFITLSPYFLLPATCTLALHYCLWAHRFHETFFSSFYLLIYTKDHLYLYIAYCQNRERIMIVTKFHDEFSAYIFVLWARKVT